MESTESSVRDQHKALFSSGELGKLNFALLHTNLIFARRLINFIPIMDITQSRHFIRAHLSLLKIGTQQQRAVIELEEEEEEKEISQASE